MRQTIALLCALAAGTALADNWNQFRGPEGDGRTTVSGLPVAFGEDENVTWKTAIHGKGWSSPVVWDDQIWLTTATEDGKRMSVLCVDVESGEIERDILLFTNAKPRYCHPTNSYASPTPFVEEGRLYVHFGSYGTAALDTETGETLWTRRDLFCDDYRGPASSPIVVDDLVMLTFDGIDVQFVVALDKQTGETVWKKDRAIEYGTDNGDRKKGYATPTVIDAGGRRQLISPSAVATIAYDPLTGDELWKVYHGGMNAAARPLFEHGLVYIAAGSGRSSLIAVRPDGRGDVTESHVAWGTGQTVPKRSSQIIHDELLFMISDGGVASCVDAKTGRTIWRRRLEGEYWASPLYAEGRIYFFSKQGRVPVLAADREFRLLADNQFDAGFNASPAVADGALILRTFTHLYRVER